MNTKKMVVVVVMMTVMTKTVIGTVDIIHDYFLNVSLKWVSLRVSTH